MSHTKLASTQKVSKSFYLDLDIIEILGQVAEEEGTSFSQAAERLIKLAIEDYEAGRLKMK